MTSKNTVKIGSIEGRSLLYCPTASNRKWIIKTSNDRLFGGSAYQPEQFLRLQETNRFARAYMDEISANWFIPYVERMANGEDVSIEEIIGAYRANNNGADPEILEQ